ncbi:MAG: glutathione synthase [Bdellovibrionales bacterium]
MAGKKVKAMAGRKFIVAIQMDALEKLSKAYDSTLCLAHAAARRGYDVFHYQPAHLRLEIQAGKTKITAAGHELKFKAGQETAYLGAASIRDLGTADVILMRQDPPFDMAYIAATHALEHLKNKVRIVNDPVSVRNAPEKLLATYFPELMPPTLITRDRKAIDAFRKKHGDVVFKPLFGYAGYGIFRLRTDDGNLHALLETMASINPEPWMVQKYIPAIHITGDKRIIMLDGEIAGSFTRIPARGDSRGNMRVGGKPLRTILTARDRKICAALAPMLRKQGLFFVGLDIIGGFLTEINVTSPTGIVVADRLAGHKGKERIAEKFWDRLRK